MKKSFKTFEEFIGDETVNSLRTRAEKIQAKNGDQEFDDINTDGVDDGTGQDTDNDDSDDEMGSGGGDF